MPSCAVSICRNYQRRMREGEVEKETYYRFPKDPKQSNVWRKKCGQSYNFNTEHARVCSKHFTSDSFIRNLRNELLGILDKSRRRLKPDAVPMLHLPFEDAEKNIKRAERAAARKWKIEKDAIIKEIFSNELAKAENFVVKDEPEQLMEILSENENDEKINHPILKSLEVEVLMNAPSEEISPPKEITPSVKKEKIIPEVEKKFQSQLTRSKQTDIPNHFISSVHEISETNHTERSTHFVERCKNCARLKLQNDGRRVRINALEQEVAKLKTQLSLIKDEIAIERKLRNNSNRSRFTL